MGVALGLAGGDTGLGDCLLLVLSAGAPNRAMVFQGQRQENTHSTNIYSDPLWSGRLSILGNLYEEDTVSFPEFPCCGRGGVVDTLVLVTQQTSLLPSTYVLCSTFI